MLHPRTSDRAGIAIAIEDSEGAYNGPNGEKEGKHEARTVMDG
jgi:hypothetical protein